MAKFIVHISEDNGHNVAQTIETNYPDSKHYKINDNWYGVKSDKLSNFLSQELGFLSDESSKSNEHTSPVVGFVARVDTMTGFFNRHFWEWYNND